jgi:hypothetical protein
MSIKGISNIIIIIEARILYPLGQREAAAAAFSGSLNLRRKFSKIFKIN